MLACVLVCMCVYTYAHVLCYLLLHLHHGGTNKVFLPAAAAAVTALFAEWQVEAAELLAAVRVGGRGRVSEQAGMMRYAGVVLYAVLRAGGGGGGRM